MASFGNHVVICDHNIDKDFDVDDGDLKNVMKKISEIDFESFDRLRPKRISKFHMWTDTKKFIDSCYKVHKVGFLSDERLTRALNKKFIFSCDDIVTVFNNKICYVNPFFLPIEYSHENIFGGSLVSQLVVQDEDKVDEWISRLNPCFLKIILPKAITQVSPINYTHEITHTQIVSHKGIVENFYNNEVLSIYYELLFSYYSCEDCFRLDLLSRMEHVISNYYSLYIYKHGDKDKLGSGYDEYRYHSDAQYLQSILIAFNLFVKTINGNNATRKRIKEQAQKVIDGKITVEQFLDSVSSSYDESKDSIYVEKLLRKVK